MDLLLLFLRMSLKKDMELLEQSFSIRKINLPEVETQLLFLEKVIFFSISSWEDSFRQMAFGTLSGIHVHVTFHLTVTLIYYVIFV